MFQSCCNTPFLINGTAVVGNGYLQSDTLLEMISLKLCFDMYICNSALCVYTVIVLSLVWSVCAILPLLLNLYAN